MEPYARPASASLHLAEAFLHGPARGRRERPALLYPGGQITYGQLSDQVNRANAAFKALGLSPGERVLLALPDSPELPIAWFGALQAGGVVCAVAPENSSEALVAYLNLSRATIAVVHRNVLPKLESVQKDCPHLRHVLSVDAPGTVYTDPHGFQQRLKEATPDPSFAPRHDTDPAVWLFTAGSTGFPKAVVHSHRGFFFSAEHYGLPVLGYREDDVCLSVAKLAFGYGLGNNLLFPLLAGASCVLFPDKPTPERVLELCATYRPTLLSTVPTALNALLRSSRLAEADFSSLRLAVCAGEPLPPELYHRWKRATGVELLDGLGSSEMFHIYVSNRMGQVKPGSLGKGVDGYELKVCNPEGHELPRGEIGSLWVKGGSMALEYFDQPEISPQTFRGDWCVTADQVYQDAEGFFFFCGRSDDLFKVSGRWVSPTEVENALLSHPEVAEAALVGCPDSDGLTQPIAFCALNNGASRSKIEEALKAWLRERLAPYKAPKSVVLVDALPRNERGKVQRAKLRALWSEHAQPAPSSQLVEDA